ncbi:hypothetical protein [Frankia sp. CiP1_Cm_nod1]|uniref:hypothetical protein n=1 Tax=Frankia sp. CiP1_Cm_nod1 TaxID=2897160 RepID=UPI0020251DD7
MGAIDALSSIAQPEIHVHRLQPSRDNAQVLSGKPAVVAYLDRNSVDRQLSDFRWKPGGDGSAELDEQRDIRRAGEHGLPDPVASPGNAHPSRGAWPVDEVVKKRCRDRCCEPLCLAYKLLVCLP